MIKRYPFIPACLALVFLLTCAPRENFKASIQKPGAAWPDSFAWWKANNLRVIQTNLPAYEAGLNADSLVADLKDFSANTLIINAGGIMAFYPTALDCQYTNPYMNKNMLGDVVQKCHTAGIRVIVRFDFSRAHKSIFDMHPDWFYISPAGERIINGDMYAVSMNAPYEQECLFRIVEEVIDRYPIDGIFINMPGYQTRNAYEGRYHGIDQNVYEKKRFAEYSNGLALPLKEDRDDPVFLKYEAFKAHTTEGIMRRLHELVKSKNDQIAICTYSEKYVDIIRHESQTNSLPYWPYNASDNVSNTRHSYPNHIVSNASIQQISFQSRYNAIEPEEITIRLYENIANGSGLDLSLMGDFQDYEDERNYEAIRTVYSHHKKFEPYFGRYSSPARIAVIAPGAWPGGESAQEYRGIQLMLKESHIQYDIIEDSQIENLGDRIGRYNLVILPEITDLSDKSITVLTTALKEGVNLLATNHSFSQDHEALRALFGARAINPDHDGSGFYLRPENKDLFKRFEQQDLLFWKFNLGLYDFSNADAAYLPILTPGRPGPPEKIGGHEPTGHFAVGIKNHPRSKAVLLPISLGKLYYIHGYEQHKNILLDLIDHVAPETTRLVQTNAPERVEIILHEFVANTAENLDKRNSEGLIVHLVNLTGFSNSYFDPLPIYDLELDVACIQKPLRVFSMVNEKMIPFKWEDGRIRFSLDTLRSFDGVVIDYEKP